MSTPATLTTDVTFALVPEWLLYSDVSAQAIRLYAVLSRYADQTGHAYPSRKTLATGLNVRSKDTVDRALKELVDLGAVTVTTRYDQAGDQTSNAYTIRRAAPAPEVAAHLRPPLPDGAATGPDGCGDGGRTDAATVAAQIVHEREPLEREPMEEELFVAADASTATSPEPATSTPAVAPAPETPRDDVERLCTRLADRIEANGSKRPTVTKAWRDAARLLLDRDHRTEDQVARAIDWCQADEFWRGNVLAMPTLRKRYDQLRLAAQRAQQPRRGDIDWDAAMERAAALDADRATNGPLAIGARP